MKFTWSFGHEQPKPVPGWRHPHPNHEKNHNSCSFFSQSFQNGCHGRTSSFSTQTDVDGCWDLEKRPLPQHHVGRYYPPYPFHGSFKIPRSGIEICQIINSQVSIYSAGLFWFVSFTSWYIPIMQSNPFKAILSHKALFFNFGFKHIYIKDEGYI